VKTKEIRALSQNEMETKLIELKDKLFKQRMQKSLGQMDDPNKIRQTRRDMAKILTILSEMRSSDGKQAKKEKS